MIKTPFKKKGEENLRPLTEKEIREKLYGAYFETGSATKEEEVEEFLASPVVGRPRQVTAAPPIKKKVPSLPKVSFSIPWKDIFSKTFRFLRGAGSFLKFVLSRMTTGWALSVVVVGVLFAAIHTLNVYRASAMRNPKPRAITEVPKKIKARKATPLSPLVPNEAVPSSLKTEVGMPSLPTIPAAAPKEPAVVTTPPAKKVMPPPALPKPYVIQVCTYSQEEDAERLVREMSDARLPAFYKPLQRANGRTFYPVFLGRYENFQEAQAKLEEFREKPVAKSFPDSFVRTL